MTGLSDHDGRNTQKLALAGELSVLEAVHTPQETRTPRDGRHDRLHAALADIDARAGRLSGAVAGYRMALAAREDRVWMRLRLAWLYMRQRRFKSAAREML